MKTLAAATLVVLAVFVACDAADAASCPPSKLVTTSGPSKSLLCLDGKYIACLHDVQRLGWSPGFCQVVLRDEENSGARK
jgi:hypothetical protein